ncbi:hypothetical protein FGO68_gene6652 [Halteria grandinella]|uniref:Uncharacterized protein n=1 Tax=Halteria grandinella TaxID=5974 RepID=A0A8J8NWU1_HALGN|nr:hypothetical protein FGO68_gene6652 [Halteria grandinella]
MCRQHLQLRMKMFHNGMKVSFKHIMKMELQLRAHNHQVETLQLRGKSTVGKTNKLIKMIQFHKGTLISKMTAIQIVLQKL